MSNILILMGSPRKNGNTELLANAFANGAEINNSVEIINVTDYAVNPCCGCEQCSKSIENKCVQSDDMQLLYGKLANADIIVISSPVYFYGISSQLKTVVDRLHTPMRNTFRVKKLALLLIAGAELPEVFDSIILQYKLILDYFNLESIGEIFVKGVRTKGAIVNSEKLSEAYKLGKSIN